MLRRRLLDGRTIAPCSICGEPLGKDLLVAAPIKRQADCSREEKLDPQIVVLSPKSPTQFHNRVYEVSIYCL